MTSEAAETGRRRVGRPPRLDRDMIATAAGEIGLRHVTMRSVADRLGVSVPGLYHYVDGRADLIRLAAGQLTRRIAVPEDSGQHWAGWLYQWAEHIHAAFVAQPDVLEQFMRGALRPELVVDNLETVVGFLVGRGFAPREALDAYVSLSGCAVGAAVTAIRDRELAAGGEGTETDYIRALADQPDSVLPQLARAVAGSQLRPPFHEQAATLLAGIAVRRGEPWEPAVEAVTARGSDA